MFLLSYRYTGDRGGDIKISERNFLKFAGSGKVANRRKAKENL